jgi:hypothetical protein
MLKRCFILRGVVFRSIYFLKYKNTTILSNKIVLIIKKTIKNG